MIYSTGRYQLLTTNTVVLRKMSYESQVKQIEKNIQEARKELDLGISLARLKENRDFKKVILEGFFEKEAIRLVHLKGDPELQDPQDQAWIDSKMKAISALSEYFDSVAMDADLAAKSIYFDEEALDQLSQE